MAITPIKIDFSKAERSTYNTRHMPAGLYEAQITEVVQKEAQDGTAMLVYTLVPTHPQYRGRRFPYYCKLSESQLWKIRDLLVAAGEQIPRRAVRIQPEKIVERYLCIEVSDDTYNGAVRSTVDSVYSHEVLRPEEVFSGDSEDPTDVGGAEDDLDSDDDLDDGTSQPAPVEDDLDADAFDEDPDADAFDEDDLDMEPTPAPEPKKAKKAKKARAAE